MRFSEYMDNWLYSDGGYYNRFKSIGKGGDFYTAVSTSSFFGASIANHLYRMIESGDIPRDGYLIEIGAHQGYLLSDMIQWLYTIDPTLIKSMKFGIVERQAHVKEAQLEYIRGRFGDDVEIEHFDDISSVEVDYAFLVSNEIFDAFPCELYKDAQIATVDNHQISWIEAPKDIATFATKHRLTTGEIAVGYEKFARSIADGIARLDFVSFDYGEKYVRNDFSIRIYREHETLPLFDEELVLSEAYQTADITYDVNFAHVIEAFGGVGIELVEHETQARALVRFGIIDILEQYSKIATKEHYLREADKIKTLISPIIMGDRFKMIHLARR